MVDLLHPVRNAVVLPRLARRHRCDALLLQNFGPLTGAVPSVVLVHDAIFLTRPELFTWWERAYFSMIRPLARHASGVATVSNTELDRLRSTGVVRAGQRGLVTHPGVDADRLVAIGEARRTAPSSGRLLIVGRQNRRKRIDRALEALARADVPESVGLDIVGPPDTATNQLTALVEELRLGSRVLLHGRVSEEDLHTAMLNCAGVLFLSEDEGFGLPIIEAMAARVPVIASDTPIHREVAGGHARFVDPDQPAELADGDA